MKIIHKPQALPLWSRVEIRSGVTALQGVITGHAMGYTLQPEYWFTTDIKENVFRISHAAITKILELPNTDEGHEFLFNQIKG